METCIVFNSDCLIHCVAHRTVHNAVQYYWVCPLSDPPALIVLRAGLSMITVQGSAVRVRVARDAALPGFVLHAADQGRRRLKITVLEVLTLHPNLWPATTLSTLIMRHKDNFHG